MKIYYKCLGGGAKVPGMKIERVLVQAEGAKTWAPLGKTSRPAPLWAGCSRPQR